MISFEFSGSTRKTEAFLLAARNLNVRPYLETGGRRGVEALRSATPVDEGIAQAGWGYNVASSSGIHYVNWTNSDVENGFKVIIQLQYGHGTGTGGYVAGRDFINPAIRPIFDSIADDIWKVVTSL